jgi:non-specific serine/threonine protein kinase
MIGKIVSHYKIIEELGRGGMGVVYRAEDLKLGRTVALKFLPRESTSDPEAKERFVQEAKAASALDHINICTVHEIDEDDDGRLFIAMACYDGGSLRSRIEQGQLGIEESLRVAVQIADGLARAHEGEIVHRDVKPANIIITGRGEVRIIDFGLAKLAGKTRLTRAGTTLGTIGYMSPEQALGEEVDRRSDIWSIGVILYEMLTGRPPFKGDFDQAVIYSILNEAPEPVTGLRSGVPMELERIIGKCLEKDPQARYQHAEDLIVDLKAALHALDTGAEGVLPDSRQPASQDRNTGAPRPESRLRRILTPSIIVALIVVLVLVFKPWKFEMASDNPAQASMRRLAVLYLANRGAADDEYLSYGITEDLIVDLTRIGTMGVAPMPSILKYKDSDEELDKIAEHLQVDLLLNGSIHKTGDNIRVSAQLIDVESGLNLWADRWEETFENLPHIKEALAQGISQALEIDTAVMLAAQVGTPDAGNPVAYDHYLRGKYTFEHKSDDADVEVALGLYRKALELEPSLSAARRGVATVLILRGQYDEANEELQVALAEARQQNLRSDEAAALRELADVYSRQSFFDEAHDYYMQALEISRELGDQSGIAWGLKDIGGSYYIQGDYAKALQSYEQSLEIFTRLGDQSGMAASTNNIGGYYARQGDLAKALRSFEQSLEIFTRLGDQSGMATATNNIGMMHWNQGDYAKAMQSFEQSLEIETRLGDQIGIAFSTMNIGNIYTRQGDYAKALQSYEQSREIFTRLGDQANLTGAVNNIGNIYKEQGDYAKAMQSFKQSLEISTRIGHKGLAARGAVRVGELYYFLDEPDSSRKYLEQELAIAEESGADAAARCYLAALAVRRGEFDKGVKQLRDLMEEARGQVHVEYELVVGRLLGEVLTKYGSNEADRQEGRATLQKALSIAEEKGIAHEIRWIRELLEEENP